MSFSAKTALSKSIMSFFKKMSIETAHQSTKLENKSNIHVFKQQKIQYAFPKNKFPILIPILIPIFPLKSIEIYPV